MDRKMVLAAVAAALALAPGAALAGVPLEVPAPASLALLAAPAAALLLARRRRARRGLSASPPPAAPAREAR